MVLGTGGVGSAALYHLAQRGVNVLGLDRFPPGHDRGSSHGHTRVIRLAYFEHPDYVPLLQRTFELWEDLQQRCGDTLYVQTGVLEIGPPDGDIVPGVLAAARQHALHVEELSSVELHRRFAGIRAPEAWVGVYEARGGYLLVEDCVRAHAEAALQAGAILRTGEEVQGWYAEGNGMVVQTDRERYWTERLVITAGAWASEMLNLAGIQLSVLRKPLLWYRTKAHHYRPEAGFPVWLFETPAGVFYGFPEIDARGLKVAEHTHGSPIAAPLQFDRQLLPADRQPVEAFLQTHFPAVTNACQHHSVCMYTMSPDQHFIIDRHPDDERVCFVAGLSGHGFKFAAVLGEAMADLALTGTTAHPIGFLGLNRFT
jgi:sarcosine oxidase